MPEPPNSMLAHRVLVTGADGYLGRRVVSRLRHDGYAVTTVRRASEPVIEDAGIAVDLAEPRHLDMLAASGVRCDIAVHLAGRVDIQLQPGSSPDARPVPGQTRIAPVYRDNVLATVNVASFCLSVSARHLIFASSQAVYGTPSERPLTERSTCRPLEHYAASKLCAEQILEVVSRQGLAVTVLRFPGVFCEERRSGVVRAFADRAVRDGRIVVRAACPVPLDVIHADDVVEAIALATRAPGSGFRCLNVSTGEPCSLELLADAIAGLVPGCVVVREGVAQPVVQCDNAAAFTALGWKPVPVRRRLQGVIAAAANETRHLT